ncbi:MAG TPA: transketolase [Terriglobales bacterium]|jgi:transketolase
MPVLTMNDPDVKQSVEQLSINTIRTLAMDAVQKANSGHPGAPMALAPAAYVLWQDYLRHNPADPHWPNRDRFVLSNGHASMLLYSLLHLTGYDLSLDDIKQFRQWNSKTPGHPEFGHTSGVETTTGPLGQGCANSVGMAIAQRWLATHYNRPGHDVVDYRVYVFCGDGDMMEGISSEAASLAGHLGLSNLIWMYDNNQISIEGSTSLAFTENVSKRFEAYNWNVIEVADVNDTEKLKQVIDQARQEKNRPTFINMKTHIAFGSPNKEGKASAHGEPLGVDEVALTKKAYGWNYDQNFYVPDEVRQNMDAHERGAKQQAEWKQRFDAYAKAFPDLAQQLQKIWSRELPAGWDKDLPNFPADAKGIATRESNAKVLNAVAKNVPWLIGGSADLAPSTKTTLTFEGAGSFEKDNYGGRNFHFGVREHGMGGLLNGIALSGIRAYGSGFLIFSDYMRGAMRLSAIMELPVIYIFTHDSVGVGEDGPTHQPIEQLMGLRGIPRMNVVRPADANEVTEAWRALLQYKEDPTVLALSRQALPTFDRTKYASAAGVAKGAYVMADNAQGGLPEIILMATGSEVQLAVGAYEKLVAEGVKARVVSMPCWSYFEKQSTEYKESVLPSQVEARVAVEMGTSMGWREYTGLKGRVVARASFGASAPLKDLLREFGFTVEHVYDVAKQVLGEVKR